MIVLILIILGMYFIGNKQNLFGSKFRISANFYSVSGLIPGNNIRLGGVNIGTVETVEISSDTTIHVVMVIKDKMMNFIKKNSLASIGTDGLIGNKIINIVQVDANAPFIQENDILQTVRAFETDEITQKLSRTNDDIAIIAQNLKEVSIKLSSPNSLTSILADSLLAGNIQTTLINFKNTSANTSVLSKDMVKYMNEIQKGKGLLGTLFKDSTMTLELKKTLMNVNLVSDSLLLITGNIKEVTQNLKNGKGIFGTLINDTTMVVNLNQTLINLNKGTAGFDENMEALKHNFLLRRYFKKRKNE